MEAPIVGSAKTECKTPPPAAEITGRAGNASISAQAAASARGFAARQAVEVWDGPVPRPFYAAVISDGSETLIGHYAHRSADIVEWSLLDRNGKTVGTFTLDEGNRLFSLQDREILGVGRDSTDVEHLLVLRIREPI